MSNLDTRAIGIRKATDAAMEFREDLLTRCAIYFEDRDENPANSPDFNAALAFAAEALRGFITADQLMDDENLRARMLEKAWPQKEKPEKHAFE
jgi:hypothetical protein